VVFKSGIDTGKYTSIDKGVEKFVGAVDHELFFECATPFQCENRLTHKPKIGVFSSRDSCHFHVVHRRGDICMALGIVGPLFKSASSFAPCTLSFVGRFGHSISLVFTTPTR
jgi:hypothetical protein